MNEFRMLSTSGILGYGFAEESLKIGMTWEPHVIGCDGGSTDPVPTISVRASPSPRACR